MPNPQASDLHVNTLLSEISVAYMNEQSDFIATKAAPIVPVKKQSDVIPMYDIGAFLKGRAEERAPATESVGGGYKVDTSKTYFCRKYSYHYDISDEQRENADDPFDPEKDAVQHVSMSMLITREQLWQKTYFKTGVWTTDWVGATDFTKWSSASSDPITDIRRASDLVKSRTGRRPNVLIVGADVLKFLEENASIRDRVKYTSAESITPQLLARLFRIEEVLVAEAVSDTSADGASASPDFIFKTHALLVYVNRTPSLRTPSAMYTFVWKPFGTDITIKQFRMEHLEADRIEGTMFFDFKVIAPDLGVFFANAV